MNQALIKYKDKFIDNLPLDKIKNFVEKEISNREGMDIKFDKFVIEEDSQKKEKKLIIESEDIVSQMAPKLFESLKLINWHGKFGEDNCNASLRFAYTHFDKGTNGSEYASLRISEDKVELYFDADKTIKEMPLKTAKKTKQQKI